MQIYYALYDPSVSTDGNYWTWTSPEIGASLNRFYGDVAVKNLPPEPNKLQNTDLWGGFVRLADWTVVYRYYNGGWDNKGRPGRYVMLTAWISATDTEKTDLLPIITNETFRYVAENAKTIPVPPPFSLKEQWVANKITPSSFQDGEKTFNDSARAMQAFAAVPSTRKARYVIADVKIIQTAEEQQFILNVIPETKSVSPVVAMPIPSKTQTGKQKEQPKSSQISVFNTMTKTVSLLIAVPLFVILLLTISRIWQPPTAQFPPIEQTQILPIEQTQIQQQIIEKFGQLSHRERDQLLRQLLQVHAVLPENQLQTIHQGMPPLQNTTN